MTQITPVMKVLEFIFSSVWHFLGCLILLRMILCFVFLIWNRLFRHLNIRKHGYPPDYCDADGDCMNKEE